MIKTVNEKELDEFIQGELVKDIDQSDKIDESVERHLQEMGFLWDRVQQKMAADSICFDCKKETVLENNEKSHLVEASSVDKGVVAFVSICEDCFQKTTKKIEEINKVKKDE